MLAARRWYGWVLWCAAFMLLFAACGSKEYPPELMEAKAAVADAKAEGADVSCPDEYTSAETTLAKAEALFEEGEDEEMKLNAAEAIKLAQIAEDCAGGKKLAAPSTLLGADELPTELAEYQESVFFDFNDNSIRPAEAAKLKATANFIKSNQDTVKFWVILASHADRPGSPADNFYLTQRRGVVVRQFLIQQGVDADRVLIQPMGEHLASTAGKKDTADANYRKVVIGLYAYKPLPGQVEGSPFLPGPSQYYPASYKLSK